jgi:hypothetical protein
MVGRRRRVGGRDVCALRRTPWEAIADGSKGRPFVSPTKFGTFNGEPPSGTVAS